MQDMCTCLLGLLIWVLDCCAYQVDKQMAGYCPSAVTQSWQGLPIVCGQQPALPHPPFPMFSPMGRLLSSWPAHGGEKGKGKGDVALHVLFAQNLLFRSATSPMLIVIVIFSGGCCPQTCVLCRTCVIAPFGLLIWVLDCCAYQVDKQMAGFCPSAVTQS